MNSLYIVGHIIYKPKNICTARKGLGSKETTTGHKGNNNNNNNFMKSNIIVSGWPTPQIARKS